MPTWSIRHLRPYPRAALTRATKAHTTRAATLARKGLEAALETLGSGAVVWGGFATNTQVSKDTIIVDRKEHAA